MYLEYRTQDETVLFHYEMASEEVRLRMRCDYLVKERVVFETITGYSEPDLEIIYVQVSTEEQAFLYGAPTHQSKLFPVEIRTYGGDEAFVHPLLTTREASDLNMVHTILDQPLVHQGKTLSILSLEMDEDRGCLVIYTNDNEITMNESSDERKEEL